VITRDYFETNNASSKALGALSNTTGSNVSSNALGALYDNGTADASSKALGALAVADAGYPARAVLRAPDSCPRRRPRA